MLRSPWSGAGFGAARSLAGGRTRTRRRGRGVLRLAGTLLIVVGVLTLAWTVLVWRWQDPFTAAYAWHEQRALRAQLQTALKAYAPTPEAAPAGGTTAAPAAARATARPAHPSAEAQATAIRHAAARFRATAVVGSPIGRLRVPRLGIDFVVVDGTDTASLEKGPGRDPRTYMPGQGHLVYIAGHRTTYLAPFAHIERLRPGDKIYLRMPYASFVYRVTSHVIVPADDLSVLRPGHAERLALQACHPRFFATHRYIVWASLVRAEPASIEA